MSHCKTISAAMGTPAFLLISFLWAGQSSAQWNYPPTRTVDVTDTYFGKTYAIPIAGWRTQRTRRWWIGSKHRRLLLTMFSTRFPRDVLEREWMELDKLRPAAYRSIVFENGRVFYKKRAVARMSENSTSGRGGMARNSSCTIPRLTRSASQRSSRILSRLGTASTWFLV